MSRGLGAPGACGGGPSNRTVDMDVEEMTKCRKLTWSVFTVILLVFVLHWLIRGAEVFTAIPVLCYGIAFGCSIRRILMSDEELCRRIGKRRY